MPLPIRLACFGTGYFSRFQYRAWKRIPEVELVVRCNRHRDKAEEFAAEFEFRQVFTDLGVILGAVKPNFLDIITPSGTHLLAISPAGARKIDVICQQPFCATFQEAGQAVTIAKNMVISVTIHENFRF